MRSQVYWQFLLKFFSNFCWIWFSGKLRKIRNTFLNGWGTAEAISNIDKSLTRFNFFRVFYSTINFQNFRTFLAAAEICGVSSGAICALQLRRVENRTSFRITFACAFYKNRIKSTVKWWIIKGLTSVALFHTFKYVGFNLKEKPRY